MFIAHSSGSVGYCFQKIIVLLVLIKKMAEKVIDQRRKSQLFLNSFSPVTITYDEFVKKKLKPGKYLTTKTAIIKMVGMVRLMMN